MKSRNVGDEERTLRVLLGWPVEEPPYPTPLVERVEEALNTPLHKLTAEQIRLLAGQRFGLEYVIPKALNLLTVNPLIGITFYDGDLLSACLRADTGFWSAWPELHARLKTIVDTIELDQIEDKELPKQLEAFRPLELAGPQRPGESLRNRAGEHDQSHQKRNDRHCRP